MLLANDQPIANSTARVDVPSMIQTVAKATSSKPNGPDLLDLPPEIREMISRHILVEPKDKRCWDLESRSPVNILSTTKLIHGEVSEIFYGEKRFRDCFVGNYFPKGSPPWVTNLMLNIEISINLIEDVEDADKFSNFMRNFGDLSII